MRPQPGGGLTFEVFTLFPELIEGFVGAGLMAKAIERGHLSVHCTNYRDYSTDRHRSVDDTPFGGGGSMLIAAPPVVAALEDVQAQRGPMHRVLLTPSAPRFDQRTAERLARHERIGLLCARYEGIDDRVREDHVDECLSLGDFVLNGGEVAAAAIIEAVARLRVGVLGNPESARHESFAEANSAGLQGTLLEHPHYTRPAEFRGRTVPEVLQSGDHRAIDEWRRHQACLRTWDLRPDLRPQCELSQDHPIYLAVDDQYVLDHLGSALDGVRALCSGRDFRDLSQLRKRVRRDHDRAPWLVHLDASPEPSAGPQTRLEVALDCLKTMHRVDAIPPLILLAPHKQTQEMHAFSKIDKMRNIRIPCEGEIGNRLANSGLITDVSHPQRERVLKMTRAALLQLRRSRSGKEPNDQELFSHEP